MSVTRLNGASVHAERPAGTTLPIPDATACWLDSLESRRQHLFRELRSLDIQREGAEKHERIRLSLIRLGEELVQCDEAEVAVLKAHLDAFDKESQGLFAKLEGEIRRIRAQIEHNRGAKTPGANGPGDALALQFDAKLTSSAQELAGLQESRRALREPIRERWSEASRRGLHTGLAFLALVEPHMVDLRTAGDRTSAIRQELLHLNALAAMAVTASDRADA